MDVKELLRDAAEEADVSPRIPAQVARRARRRRARNGMLAGVTVIALLIGAGFGVRGAVGLFDDSATRIPAGETEWRGLWPQDTREAGEQTQAQADAGDVRATWQLRGDEVARRYAQQVLGFTAVYLNEGFPVEGPGDSGPITVAVTDCDHSIGVSVCKPERRAEITVERLIRRDATGIWIVTSGADARGGTVTEAQVRDFVTGFLDVRWNRDDRAHDYLSESAADQYHRGEGGLHLFGPIATTGIERILPSEQDANLYEAHVVLYERPTEAVATEVREVLLVGSDPVGPDGLIILAAEVEGGLTGGKEQAAFFVSAFMDARINGPDRAPGAESFLSPEGKGAYDQTDQFGNQLYLYGYPWDDPDYRWTSFAVTDVQPGGKEYTYVVDVNIERASPDGSGEPPASFWERLVVGPGQDLQGQQQDWVVLSAEWVDV
jgi:hypothetical protein